MTPPLFSVSVAATDGAAHRLCGNNPAWERKFLAVPGPETTKFAARPGTNPGWIAAAMRRDKPVKTAEEALYGP
jgi:hypothetical protein